MGFFINCPDYILDRMCCSFDVKYVSYSIMPGSNALPSSYQSYSKLPVQQLTSTVGCMAILYKLCCALLLRRALFTWEWTSMQHKSKLYKFILVSYIHITQPASQVRVLTQYISAIYGHTSKHLAFIFSSANESKSLYTINAHALTYTLRTDVLTDAQPIWLVYACTSESQLVSPGSCLASQLAIAGLKLHSVRVASQLFLSCFLSLSLPPPSRFPCIYY